MLQSKLFGQTLRTTPKEAVIPSHRLLIQGGFIDQLASGIWSFLPLGFRVHFKIENIIREEMNNIGGQEIFLPALQPQVLWQETGRLNSMEPPLFKLKDQHQKGLVLGSTHEEVITDLLRKNINSYKQLPMALYQIQTKFRNEIRSTGGLLRVREFVMKDLYSFHTTEEDLDRYYLKVLKVYQRIFKRCGLKTILVEASAGSIGGGECHEFMVVSKSGEDKILFCPNCHYGINKELASSQKSCPNCQRTKLREKNTIEAGHIFKLGTDYSQKMKATFLDIKGQPKPIIMGCYGIGLGRLMATIVEISHDKDGIIWPLSVAPFQIHLLNLSQRREVRNQAVKIYQALQKLEFEILYDDRQVSPGIKLKDADLIGIPLRLIVSDQTKGKIEIKLRNQKKTQLISYSQLNKKLKRLLKPYV